MSRRQSRVSLVDRQNEALQEFESLKRKYLHYNKQIIKENSLLRVQLEALKGEMAKVHDENVYLSQSNISLKRQLKRAQAQGGAADRKKIMATDAAAAAMIKQLEALRQSFLQITPSTSPSPPPSEATPTVLREKPSASTRLNIISRAPEFSLIQEDEEDITVQLDPLTVPLPTDDEDTSPRSLSPTSSIEAIRTSNVTARRKPSRRQSGLLGPSRPRDSTSPVEPPQVEEENEVDDMLVADAAPPPSVAKTRKRAKPGDGTATKGLYDVTNSPPRRDRVEAPAPGIMSVLDDHREDEPHVQKLEKPLRHKPKSLPAPLRPSITEDAQDADALFGAEAGEHGQGARPTRARKSVNYAEPKLNTKMRKPDEAAPQPYAYPTLTTTTPLPTKAMTNPSTTITANQRPIKARVLPSSLVKTSMKPKEAPKPLVEEPPSDAEIEPKPRKEKPRRHAGAIRIPSLSPRSSPVPFSEHETAEDDDEEEEEESEADEKSSDGDSDDNPTPKKSPRRSTAKVMDDFKCASLSVAAPITKPSRIATAVSSRAERSNITASSSKPMPRPAAASTSMLALTRPATGSSANAGVTEGDALRKRKTAPVKYVYLDISDDEDATTAAPEDDDYNPVDRRKSAAAVGASKPRVDHAKPLSAGSAKDRRHSMNA